MRHTEFPSWPTRLSLNGLGLLPLTFLLAQPPALPHPLTWCLAHRWRAANLCWQPRRLRQELKFYLGFHWISSSRFSNGRPADAPFPMWIAVSPSRDSHQTMLFRSVLVAWLSPAFLNLGTMDVLAQIIPCSGGCPVPCGMLSSILCLHLLDASSTPPNSNKTVSRHC